MVRRTELGEGFRLTWRGADRTCEHCGIRYRDFRTGYRYRDVFEMLKDYSEDPADWRYKRRHTVLGYWHQIKLEMWEAHCPEARGHA